MFQFFPFLFRRLEKLDFQRRISEKLSSITKFLEFSVFRRNVLNGRRLQKYDIAYSDPFRNNNDIRININSNTSLRILRKTSFLCRLSMLSKQPRLIMKKEALGGNRIKRNKYLSERNKIRLLQLSIFSGVADHCITRRSLMFVDRDEQMLRKQLFCQYCSDTKECKRFGKSGVCCCQNAISCTDYLQCAGPPHLHSVSGQTVKALELPKLERNGPSFSNLCQCSRSSREAELNLQGRSPHLEEGAHYANSCQRQRMNQNIEQQENNCVNLRAPGKFYSLSLKENLPWLHSADTVQQWEDFLSSIFWQNNNSYLNFCQKINVGTDAMEIDKKDVSPHVETDSF